MGHYASEMQCDTCGKLRCACKIEQDERIEGYVVADDFTVLSAEMYIAKNRYVQMRWGMHDNYMLTRMKVLNMPRYKTREEAEVAARLTCEQAVEHARSELYRLKDILKTVRPWEK